MSQQLSPEDIHLFYTLNPALLWYVNEKRNVLRKTFENPEALRVSGVESVTKVRDFLLKNTNLIDEFVRDNPFHFSNEELNIISHWKHFVRGKFYVMKLSKEYAILLDDSDPAKVYGIKALATPFENFFDDVFPILIETVLIPFRGYIIYDGFIHHFNVSFGSGYRFDLRESFAYAKTRFGIVTSLPFIDQSAVEGDDAKLKRYLKTRGSRELFQREITALIQKDKKLALLYHQEMGRIQSLGVKRALCARGIVSGHFGILQEMIVTVGETRIDLERMITKIVPANTQEYIFRFEMRMRK